MIAVAIGPVELSLPAGIFCLVLLGSAMKALYQTTLVAPIAWAAFALVGFFPASYHDDYRYAYAVFLIAPTLAVLGAKRPQNAAWQFIVLTLVGVLLLPVLQGWAFGDERPHVHTLFRWLIAAHIVVGVVNYLPTRYAGPAMLFGLTQTVAAADYLPFSLSIDPRFFLFVPWCQAAALVWARFAARRTLRVAPGLDRLWRDFRDAYGLVWGLRVAERLNAAAAKHGRPVEFAWGGMLLREGTGELDDDVRRRIERELRSHLRRFVSHEWIAQRMHSPPSDGRGG